LAETSDTSAFIATWLIGATGSAIAPVYYVISGHFRAGDIEPA